MHIELGAMGLLRDGLSRVAHLAERLPIGSLFRQEKQSAFLHFLLVQKSNSTSLKWVLQAVQTGLYSASSPSAAAAETSLAAM